MLKLVDARPITASGGDPLISGSLQLPVQGGRELRRRIGREDGSTDPSLDLVRFL